MSTFTFDLRAFGPRVALSNLRFNIAYRLGGFTSARR